MATLREMIEQDLHSVFMNTDEHATEHTIDNESVVCIVDDDLLNENPDKSGTYKADKIIHIPLCDLEGLYVAGANIVFDSVNYTVLDVVEADGMVTMTLKINESY